MNMGATLTSADLAQALLAHEDAIVDEVMTRFARRYTHSTSMAAGREFSRNWSRREIRDFLNCISAEGASDENISAWVGDAVVTHYELLSPLMNRLEMLQLYAEVCSEFLWEEFMGDSARLEQAMGIFEGCIERLIASDAAVYFKAKLSEGALRQTWKLGPRFLSPENGSRHGGAEFDLSGRQLQIVRFVAEGRSNGQIASALGISSNTVKNHLAAIYAKLNVGNRTELALLAEREGLLK